MQQTTVIAQRRYFSLYGDARDVVNTVTFPFLCDAFRFGLGQRN